ncbi:MAG: SPOR domain-containing protein [Deltaproteobacteria bacterium]|nr:SPOR domain-containing protein [Deltaproteobacteria bacterium]
MEGEIEIHAIKRRRAASPRRSRLRFELARGTVVSLGAAGVTAFGVVFALGYWLGRGEPAPIEGASAPAAAPAGAAAPAAPPPTAPGAAAPAAPPPTAPGAAALAAPPPTAPGAAAPAAPPPTAPGAATAAAPPPAEPPPARPLQVSRTGPGKGYGLQLGAYPTEQEALAFLEAHRAALGKLPLFIVVTTIADRGTWYRVRAGAVAQRDDAERLKASLPADLRSAALLVSHR